MTKEERRASILTALAMCAVMDDKPKKGNKNERECFTYYVPFVGARVRDGIVAPKIHGGHDNANANALDESLLAAWCVDFAENIGDVVPVRVRRGGIQDGTRRRYFSYDEYTLLPAVHDPPRPSRTSFIRILSKHCPKIKIRSGRDQVCDQCAIYRSAIAPDAGAQDTEVFGEHLVDAKALRTEYKIDTAQAANNKLVFVMDFSQNLTTPHVPDTPSAWYFLSLFSVSMFGVYCTNDETHTHFLYSERKGSKGVDEVISMLHHKLDLHGVFDVAFADPDEPLMQDKSVVVWCDNCGGQNKNSYLIWYLLFLVEHGVLQTACLKFFMKGHTKNACDRGFGHVKRHMTKAACWDMHTLIKAVEESATSIQTINLDATEQPFWPFKTYFQPRYKKLMGIQRFQVFTMSRDAPGRVECKRTPTSEPTVLDLRRRTIASAPTAETSTMAMFGETWRSIPKADDPPLNPEKQLDHFRKIRPFVPPEFKNDPLYAKPPENIQQQAREIKRSRRQRMDAKRRKVDEGESKESTTIVAVAVIVATRRKEAQYPDMNMNGGFDPSNAGDGTSHPNMNPLQTAPDTNNSTVSSNDSIGGMDQDANHLQNDAFLQSLVDSAVGAGRARELLLDDDESAKKRMKLDPSLQQQPNAAQHGVTGQVLNDGMGNVSSYGHVTGSMTMALSSNPQSLMAMMYNPMAIASSGGTFGAPNSMTSTAPAQPSTADLGNNATPMDFNMFQQSVPAAYSSMPPNMMMTQGNARQQQQQLQQFQQQQQQFQQQRQNQQQQLQQQSQQRQQQQQQLQFLAQQRQYAAAVAAANQRNSGNPAMQQQPQSQAMLATMLQQQQANNATRAAVAAALLSKQQLLSSGSSGAASSPTPTTSQVNIHAASVMPPRQQMPSGNTNSAAIAAPSTVAVPAAAQVKPVTPPVDAKCLICKEKGDVFTCNGSCGLNVHRACIGEEVLFPFLVGPLCGNCFVMQQNRASKENLQKGGTNGLSVRRAILYLNLETNSQSNFDKFGHLASLRLLEIGDVAGYPIKPFAEKFVEPYLQRWIREKLVHVDKWVLNVREIFTLLVGLYSLQRACIAHGMKEKIIALVKARNFSATDYLGWHPSIEGPQVECSSLCQICAIRNPPETVRASYKGLKPYDADGFEWDKFAEQLRMVFGMIDVVSNFGVLQLNPDLFEPELKIICNPNYVNHAMLTMEYEVVGKFLQCMRLFGPAKSTELSNFIAVCERFILVKQMQNGSWCKINGTAADQYKATSTCAKALVQPAFQGYGPASGEFLRLLEKWAKATPNSKYPDVPNMKVLASGIKVKPQARANLKHLEAIYRWDERQMVPESGVNPLERLVTERLHKIFPSKKQEPVDEAPAAPVVKSEKKEDQVKPEAESDAASGQTDSEDVKQESVKQESDSKDGAVETSGASESSAIVKESNNTTTPAEDEDALTSLSLNEDLEIFDGLKFEDGDVIDVNVGPQSLQMSEGGDEEDGNEDQADQEDQEDQEEDNAGDGEADTDGAETVERPDEEEEEDMEDVYDDDDDENETDPNSENQEASEEAAQQEEEEQVPQTDADFSIPEQMDGESLFADNSSGDFSLDM
ncbi:hypothetical protein FI667_g2211, partial [Globisporangium splendens]